MAYGGVPGVGVVPAGPLLDVVDRLAREAGGIGAVAHDLEISPRLISAWRAHERIMISAGVADRVLTHARLNWHDVWAPCTHHELPRPFCGACEAHLRARYVFTGEPWPAPWSPDGHRPVLHRGASWPGSAR